MSDSDPVDPGPTRLLCPWNSPGKNTAVGCHFLLQAIFPTQGSNLHLLCLLHLQVASLHPQGRVSVYALHPLSISLFIFMPWKLCSLSLQISLEDVSYTLPIILRYCEQEDLLEHLVYPTCSQNWKCGLILLSWSKKNFFNTKEPIL